MCKLIRKFMTIILVNIIIFTGHFNFSLTKAASEETYSKDSDMFVIKSNKAYDDILDTIKSKFPALCINNMEEISTFSIKSDDSVLLNNAEHYISNQYSDFIEEESSDSKIELSPIELVTNIPPDNEILSQSSFSLNKTSVELNNQYEVWRWDIDKVTDNRESYKIQEGSHKVKVGIIDSGIDENHPDLKDNIIDSKSFVPGNSSLEDTLGHGTMVAGEIAANGNVKGVAPKIAIASYKVFNGSEGESSWVIRAIIQAVNDHMDVINLSLGTYKSLLDKNDLATVLAYKRAILYAQLKNCLVVAASGTESQGMNISNPLKLAQELGYKDNLYVYIPGGISNVLTVSATNKNDQLAYYSNYGSSIKIAAPAGDYGPNWETQKIADLRYMALVTYPTNLPQSQLSSLIGFKPGYEFIQGGTSLAAPKVAAAAALLILQYEEKYGFKPSVSKIEQLLYKGATPGGNNNEPLYYGSGILNVENSLNLVIK